MGRVEMKAIPDINNGTGSSIKMAKKKKKNVYHILGIRKPVWLGLCTVVV